MEQEFRQEQQKNEEQNPAEAAAGKPEEVTPAEAADKPDSDDAASDAPKKSFAFQKSIDDLYDENLKQDPEPPEGDGAAAEGEADGKRKKPRAGGRLLAVIYSVLILTVAALIATIAISCVTDMYGITKPDQQIPVTVPRKASSTQIAKILKDEGVINNDLFFRIYIKLKHVSGLQQGTYELNSDMQYSQIIAILKKPTIKADVATVTIPEGKTLEQIGDILQEKGVCSQQEFISATQKGGFRFDYDAQVPADSKRFYKYEGYLFPDTYQFYKDSTGKQAAQKLLMNFDGKFTAQMKTKAAQMGMTVDQVVTLASIIQAETGNVQQMPVVSSVFHNRLANGVKENGGKKYLQSDATIFYVLHDIQPVLQQSSTEISSAYNTYKAEGLPPGPICNPGLDAINAALNPASTDYYYFVTDDNGDYFYASTYAQHAKNVKKALKYNAAKGTDIYQ